MSDSESAEEPEDLQLGFKNQEKKMRVPSSMAKPQTRAKKMRQPSSMPKEELPPPPKKEEKKRN